MSIIYRVEVIGSLVRRALLNAAGNKWHARTFPTPECRRLGRPSLFLLTALLFALCGAPCRAPRWRLTRHLSRPPLHPRQPPSRPRRIAPQALGELGNLIAAGKLADLRWPNFTDFQAEVVKFYALGANALAWVHDGQPTAQAQAMISSSNRLR